MRLSVGFQMDPLEPLNINGDTTWLLMMEAQRRGHRVLHFQPQDVSVLHGRVRAMARPVTLRQTEGDHVTFGPAETVDLHSLDVVWIRQDPPFDMAYVANTHLMALVAKDTLVLNDPTSIRDCPEKLFVLQFQNFMPPTLISRDRTAIEAFRAEHGDIIVKPLFGNGGAGVFHLRPEDSNLGSLLAMFDALSREPLMVQRYLPAVRDGDKRILLIDGKPAGALNRIPNAGDARSNLHVGGHAAPTTLTPREQDMCAALGPELEKRGLVLVGIDVIGDHLTEINVTSPTGMQEINRFDGVCLEATVWDAVDRRLEAHRMAR